MATREGSRILHCGGVWRPSRFDPLLQVFPLSQRFQHEPGVSGQAAVRESTSAAALWPSIETW
jgi:hypothetical protein